MHMLVAALVGIGRVSVQEGNVEAVRVLLSGMQVCPVMLLTVGKKGKRYAKETAVQRI